MGTVAGDDTVGAVGHFEVDEKDSTGAHGRDGVLPAAVDDGCAHTLQREAVGRNHDGSRADTGEADGAVRLANVAHSFGERFLAAVEGIVGDAAVHRERATSWVVARRNEATGGSSRPRIGTSRRPDAEQSTYEL